MCGIVGEFKFDNIKVTEEKINKMLNSIKHRGPDNCNLWLKNNVGLGHRLLKIQDLSEKSFQPYKYENLVMTYNGEIYNFQELKKQLESENLFFETIGDTEVLIKAFRNWGIEKTLEKIEGCYAIGLYDLNKEKLYLIRDRFGIKPLHYYKDNKKIVFSSEIKAILQDEEIKREYNKETVAISLACKLWMHPELTMFKNIYTIEPGTYLEISKNDLKKVKYYKMDYTVKITNKDVAIKQFGELFIDSVRRKLISKVPIAAFLSGGIDSSLLCKIAKDNIKDKQLDTYTICYNNDNDLDLNHARELAEKEKFKQHDILINDNNYSIENIDNVIYAVEEILIDKVYLPVYFNYREAKKDGFTVVLNGQGSDEVWLGYIFNWGIYNFIKPSDNTETLIKEYYLPNMIFKGKLNKDFEVLVKKSLYKYLYDNLERFEKKEDNDKLNNYSIMSIRTILHDLLLQEDKLAMAHSVESRVPFVDSHKLVELSMSMPGKLKIADGREKFVLRSYGKDMLPRSIIQRKKYAFPEPPNAYDDNIFKICNENWNKIKKCNIIKIIIDEQYLEDIHNFTNTELWWILVYWRFSEVFKMEEI